MVDEGKMAWMNAEDRNDGTSRREPVAYKLTSWR